MFASIHSQSPLLTMVKSAGHFKIIVPTRLERIIWKKYTCIPSDQKIFINRLSPFQSLDVQFIRLLLLWACHLAQVSCSNSFISQNYFLANEEKWNRQISVGPSQKLKRLHSSTGLEIYNAVRIIIAFSLSLFFFYTIVGHKSCKLAGWIWNFKNPKTSL